MTESIHSLLPGTLINSRFRIVQKLGHGGMGSVWQIQDSELSGEILALKFMHLSSGDGKTLSVRDFQDEMRAALKVTSPYVCRVFSFERMSLIRNVESGEENIGPAFITMEYVNGEHLASLRDRIGAIPLRKGLDISIQICKGLRAIHKVGICHSDLKPKNIILDAEAQIKILDFGVASGMNEPGRGGTPRYMAPERFQHGALATIQSDIYECGLVLFELFSGIEIGPERSELTGAALSGLPIELRDLIIGCLAPNPAERPSSTDQIIETLGNIFESSGWSATAGAALPNRPDLVLREFVESRPWGEVWLATDTNLGVERLLKISSHSSQVRYLEREVTRFKAFKDSAPDDSAVLDIVSARLNEAPYYIEIECPKFTTLDRWATSSSGLQQMSLAERLKVVRRIVASVVSVHGAGLIHLDIRPTMILVEDTGFEIKIWLRDVGPGFKDRFERTAYLSSLSDPQAHFYQAPESTEANETATSRADIYALGILMGQILLGNLSAFPLARLSEIEDDLLRNDIEHATSADPSERLGYAFLLLGKLRQLEERRRQEQMRMSVEVAEASRRRWGQVALAATVSTFACLLLLSTLLFQHAEINEQKKLLQQSVDFFEKVLEIPDPVLGTGNVTTARGLLLAASELADDSFSAYSEPGVHARSAIGIGLQRLGVYEASRPILERAATEVQEIQRLRTIKSRELRQSEILNALAEQARLEGDWEQATYYNDQALDLLDSEEPSALRAWILETEGLILQSSGHFQEALKLHEQVTAMRRAMYSVDSFEYVKVAVSLNNEGTALFALSKWDVAEQKFRQSLEIRQESTARLLMSDLVGEIAAGEFDRAFESKVSTVISNIAAVQIASREYAKAVETLGKALELSRKLLGNEHPDVAKTLNQLGWAYEAQGRYAEAEEVYEEALKIRRATLPEGHPEIANSIQSHAWLLAERGQFGESESKYREALKIRESSLPVGHPDITVTERDLAWVLLLNGEFEEAIKIYEDALEYWQERDDPVEVAYAQVDLARALMADGKQADALDLAEKTLEFWRTEAGDEPWYEVAWTLEQLGLLYQKAGRFEDGEADLREAIEIHEQVDTPESLDLGKAKTRLARLLLEQGRAQEALEQADQAVKLLEERAPIEDHWRTLHAKAVRGGALAAVGRLGEARSLLEKVYTKLRSIRGDLNEETGDARRYLMQVYERMGAGTAAARLNQDYLGALETGGRRPTDSENTPAVQE